MALRTLSAVAAVTLIAAQANTYTVDDSTCSATTCRNLDGIGGLSGGGATSVLLPYYPEPQKSQILDYLFKPNFGASLHILKVEIGGDAQSTDGAESSHMHSYDDEDYNRGYEWFLMVEAKKRNPDIKLYGLSWAWPQWVSCNPGTLSNCTNNPWSHPQQSADYTVKWVAGAKANYNLTIDYIGSWNERSYDITYLKTLRSALDAAGFTSTAIVAPDAGWNIAGDILKDAVLAKAVHAIGAHYPGMQSSADAKTTGKPLWASEDDSTYNNDVGAACWGRVINRNYVNGQMTGSINWNLIAAYTKGTNWYRAGIMNAMQPWSGNYGSSVAGGGFTAGPMVWTTAHTTQFSQPGWTYLKVGSGSGTGSGPLKGGGSYVTLRNYATQDFSIIVEKFSKPRSSCVRPALPAYSTTPEVATFQLAGDLKSVSSLHLWYTHFAYLPGDKTEEFVYMGTVPVVGGTVSLNVTVDSMYTLTTIATGNKGTFDVPPPPVNFPAVWKDDFESCPLSSEGALFADQNGIFECVKAADAAHGIVMEQKIPLKPITWGGDIRPHSLVGHRDTANASITIDGFVAAAGASVLLGAHMQGTDNSAGLIWSTDTTGTWWVHTSINAVGTASQAILTGKLTTPAAPGEWHTYRLDVNTSGRVQRLNVWMDGTPVISGADVSNHATTGHFAIGTRLYGEYTQYDNVQLYSSFTQCGTSPLNSGAPISVVNCESEVGPFPGTKFDFKPTNAAASQFVGTFAVRSNPSLCIASVGNAMQLAACNSNDVNQVWTWTFDGISPDNERASTIKIASSNKCMRGPNADIGSPADLANCGNAGNMNFAYDYDLGEIFSENLSVCFGVC